MPLRDDPATFGDLHVKDTWVTGHKLDEVILYVIYISCFTLFYFKYLKWSLLNLSSLTFASLCMAREVSVEFPKVLTAAQKEPKSLGRRPVARRQLHKSSQMGGKTFERQGTAFEA